MQKVSQLEREMMRLDLPDFSPGDTIKPLIEKDPCFPFCDDPSCKTCRIGWDYSKTSPFSFWLRNPKLLLYTIKNRFKK